MAAAVVAIAAVADLVILERHVRAGPFMFTGANCAGGAPAAAAPSDPSVGLAAWGMLAGNPAHNSALPADPLHASWTFRTNGSIVMAPSVVDGVAYAGSMDGCVYALDVATGRLLWSFAADNQVMSQPLVVDNEVIVGSGNKGMGRLPNGRIVRGTGESGIYALDPGTGAVRWFVQTLGESMPTPSEQDGVIYEATGGEMFYAISATTGAVLWELPVGSYVSMSSPTLSGNIAVFGGASPYALFGVNTQTQRLAWRLPQPQVHGGSDDMTPTISGGVAYAQEPDGHYIVHSVEMAIQASSGRVLWSRTLGTDRLDLVQRALGLGQLGARDGEETGVATVSNGVLYTGAPGLHGLWALDAGTGQPVWPHPAALGQAIRTAPVVSGGRIYVTSNTDLFVLDAATGRVLSRTGINAFHEGSGIMIPCSTPSPTLVGSTLLLGGGVNADSLLAVPAARP